MTVKFTSISAFAEALRRLADDIDNGEIIACSAMLDPTGLARVSATFLHGDPPNVDPGPDPTPTTEPGKRRRH